MKIVCDTNVLVSSILFGGHARRILQLAARGRVTNCISEDILEEAKNILLRPKLKLAPPQVATIITLFRDTFELVHPIRQPNVIHADPDDDRILEAAIAAQAEIIVSGDQHLRSLESWQGIRILSPAEFVRGNVGEQSSPAH